MSSDEQEPVIIRDNRKIDRTPPSDADRATSAAPEAAEVAQSEESRLLDERTADLQRLQAEYANYRKRAERERLAAGEVAISRVLTDFVPVLDDLDRARAHGDLTGGLKAVADQLEAIFAKLGLEAFGTVGDPFDPAIHEAVLHDESNEVTEPTCTTVMRQGYRHGERLLRPAMVGVTDPASPVANPTAEPELAAPADAE
ncbi:nucleotide exchange factor GrpE [Jatrophihabitans sp.]|uniref:nucleotide exchange factor GrpE n=1 Tax=Jatrophihabitans sp. TaxID=1932789 RepID=UPI0030C6790B|nr:co-chaperone GrpE [Jatrophihabitans sp.]